MNKRTMLIILAGVVLIGLAVTVGVIVKRDSTDTTATTLKPVDPQCEVSLQAQADRNDDLITDEQFRIRMVGVMTSATDPTLRAGAKQLVESMNDSDREGQALGILQVYDACSGQSPVLEK